MHPASGGIRRRLLAERPPWPGQRLKSKAAAAAAVGGGLSQITRPKVERCCPESFFFCFVCCFVCFAADKLKSSC